MIPAELRALLRASGVRYCVIGAHALAVHGVARFTADVDLLTMDTRVLGRDFWPSELMPELRWGDDDDPLRGVARFEEPTVDVIVGRGPVMQRAVDEAREPPLEAPLNEPVARPVDLALLKLEAGGVQDLADVQLLIEARRRAGEDLRAKIAGSIALASAWGRGKWVEVQRRLDG